MSDLDRILSDPCSGILYTWPFGFFAGEIVQNAVDAVLDSKLPGQP